MNNRYLGDGDGAGPADAPDLEGPRGLEHVQLEQHRPVGQRRQRRARDERRARVELRQRRRRLRGSGRRAGLGGRHGWNAGGLSFGRENS